MTYDCIIVGGGPAGLNAALVLGRARKSVLVIDAEEPRNRVTRHSHGFLTRDGITPHEFRRVAKEQIEAYPNVTFTTDTAISAGGADGDFTITTEKGTTYHSKKLLLAIGKRDLKLPIDGLAEVYGKSAFVCPYCDGWELRDQKLVVIVSHDKALHMAKTLSGWSRDFTICTNGDEKLTEQDREELNNHNISVFDTRISEIKSIGGMVESVHLEDGTMIPCTGIFFAPELGIGSDLPQLLDCESSEDGTIVVDKFGKTSVPGVYSAGDSATQMYQLIMAASMGSLAAVGINSELLAEAWEQSW
ncbi:NAD(P)/FAD-dependent oxidoreductase [Paenibacillus sp. 453mf]|uniref:NAD(P)/FAD-dependent oxidoreductase n=1 Tax=Paenibacillus sp. 453mf TaxID=1761874 RepID=UPI0008EBDE16|nr:NAD(P)/FAD-dependent oxidoreductase [Paenibacillus sp. 453mf]SFS53149.1 Thioredoxin reductase [Paenibacillus sp. 453mf]